MSHYRRYFLYASYAICSILGVIVLAVFLLLLSLQYASPLWYALMERWLSSRCGHAVLLSAEYHPNLFSRHPSVLFEHVRMGRIGEELRIGQLGVRFSWQDIFFHEPHLQWLHIAHVVVPIVHVHHRLYRIASFPFERDSKSDWDWAGLLEQEKISIQDAVFQYTDLERTVPHDVLVHVNHVSWTREEKRPSLLALDGYVSSAGDSPFKVQLAFDHLVGEHPATAHVSIHMTMEDGDIPTGLQLLSPPAFWMKHHLHCRSGKLSVHVNAEWDHARMLALRSDISVSHLQFVYRGQLFDFPSVTAHPRVRFLGEEITDNAIPTWDIGLDPFVYTYRQKIHRLPSLHLRIEKTDQSGSALLTSPLVSLPELVPLMKDYWHAVHPSSVLNRLSLIGTLSSFRLMSHWSADGVAESPRIEGHLDDIGVHDERRGIADVSGDFSWVDHHLSVLFNAPRLTVTWPDWYSKPIQTALVGQCQVKGGQDFSCRSLHLQFAHIDILGRVALLFPEGHAPVVDMHLRTDVLPARQLYQYFPEPLADVRDYCRHAFLDGYFGDVTLDWQGSLADFPYRQRQTGHFLMKAHAHDVRMRYADDWPILSQVSADIAYDGHKIQMTDLSAQGQDHAVHLTKGVLTFPDVTQPRLLLSGDVLGEATAYWSFMRSTPLKTYVEAWSHLSFMGPVKTHFSLVLPWEKPSDIQLDLLLSLTHVALFWQSQQLCDLSGHLHIKNDFLTVPTLLQGTCDQAPWSLRVQHLPKSASEEVLLDGVMQTSLLARLFGGQDMANLISGPMPLHLTLERKRSPAEMHIAAQADLRQLSFSGPLSQIWPEKPRSLSVHYMRDQSQHISFTVDRMLSLSARLFGGHLTDFQLGCALDTVRPLSLYHSFMPLLSSSNHPGEGKRTAQKMDFSWLKQADWQIQCDAKHWFMSHADQGALSLVSQHHAGDHWLKWQTHGWTSAHYVWDIDTNAMAVDMAYLRWHVPPMVGITLTPSEFVEMSYPQDTQGRRCPIDRSLYHIDYLLPCTGKRLEEDLFLPIPDETGISPFVAQPSPLLDSLTTIVPQNKSTPPDHLTDIFKTVDEKMPEVADFLSYFSLLNIDIHAISVGRTDFGMFSFRGEKRRDHFVMTKLLLTSPLFHVFFLEDPFVRHPAETHYLFAMDVSNLQSLVYPSGSDDPAIQNGQLTLKGQLSWPIQDVLPPLRDLSGHLDLTIAQAQLPRIRPGFAKILGLLNIGYFARYVTGQEKGSLMNHQFFFDLLSTELSIAAGQMHFQHLDLKSPLVSLTGSGTLFFFPWPVRFDGEVLVLPDTSSSSLIVGALLGLSPLSLLLLNANSFVLSHFSSLIGIRYKVGYDKGEWTVGRP